MPFTLAHPAAAVPLVRPLGRFGVLSALVIGSMMPDLVYFMPLDVTRTQSHSFQGLFWFCLPLGSAVYLLFHLLVKRPGLELLPEYVARRAVPFTEGRLVPIKNWLDVIGVLVSLWIGAVTHLLWDQFTHDNTWVVQQVPALNIELCNIQGYRICVYTALQIACSVVGLLVLGLWARLWLRSAAPCLEHHFLFAPAARNALLACILGVAACVALSTASAWLGYPLDGLTVRSLVVRSTVAGTSAVAVGVLAFSLIWQALALRGG